MTEDKKPLNTPIVRLPRVADRAIRVWHAYREVDPGLDAYGAAMVEAHARFQTGLTALHTRQGEATPRRRKLKDAIHELLVARRSCLSVLRRDLPDLDTTGLNGSTVVEDVIAESRLVLERGAASVGDAPKLAYTDQVLTSLTEKLAQAEEAADAVSEADALVDQARLERYAAAMLLDDKLIVFRAIVRTVFGSAHPAYHRVRPRTAREERELDDPEVDELEPASAEPAGAEPASAEPEGEERPVPPVALGTEPASPPPLNGSG